MGAAVRPGPLGGCRPGRLQAPPPRTARRAYLAPRASWLCPELPEEEEEDGSGSRAHSA